MECIRTHSTVVREEYGVGLDVAVNHSVLMQEAERLQARLAHRRDLLLVHPAAATTTCNNTSHSFARQRPWAHRETLKSRQTQ